MRLHASTNKAGHVGSCCFRPILAFLASCWPLLCLCILGTSFLGNPHSMKLLHCWQIALLLVH